MKLTDYKVRDLNTKEAKGAKVRVLIESSTKDASWNTVGVSENIIEASWLALVDSFSYFLMKHGKEAKVESSETVGEAMLDFIYFSDFYLICGLLIAFMLYLIIKM